MIFSKEDFSPFFVAITEDEEDEEVNKNENYGLTIDTKQLESILNLAVALARSLDETSIISIKMLNLNDKILEKCNGEKVFIFNDFTLTNQLLVLLGKITSLNHGKFHSSFIEEIENFKEALLKGEFTK